MNIGYDAKRLFCNHRGLGNYSRDLIRILSQYYPENHYTLYTPKVRIQVELNHKNCETVLPEGFYKLLPSSLWRNNGITSQIKSRKNEIYHGLNQEFPMGIEKLDVKKVITFHDAIFIRYPELYDNSYRRIFTAKNKRSCLIADSIIAISEQSKQDAIQFFKADPNKVHVVYQGCNNIFRQELPPESIENVRKKYNLPQQYLLFVGAIEPRKNIATILQALRAAHIDLPLVVVGKETKYSAELIDLAHNLQLSSQVIFRNNVTTPDLPALYQMAEIFIYPSIFEGFGIPILEALCSKTPVISSRGSCFEETGGPCSVYVDPTDEEEMGASITQILENHDVREKMIAQGLVHSSHFTDEKIAQNIMRVYCQ